MKQPTKNGTYGRLAYSRLDVMDLPGSLPEQGIPAGSTGEIHKLDLVRNGNEVVARVRVPYSTGQTRCWLDVKLRPDGGIISYAPVS